MTLEEAFYKQKDELHAAQREIRKLNKELEASRKGVAADETFQKQLKQIRGLKNKVSEMTHISDRYKELYQNEQAKVAVLSDKVFNLELELLQTKDKLALYEHDSPSDSPMASDEAAAQIAALKDEVARLTAQLNHDGTNTGTPTSKTSIDKKKIIPNSRKKTGLNKGGQPGHKKHSMPPFSDEEITEIIDHELASCPECGSHNLKQVSVTNKDEYEYEVKVIKRRNRFPEYICQDCGRSVRAPLNGLVAPNQYGSTVQAMALALMNVGIVSINRTRRILTGFSPDSISLCEGYLIKLQKRYSKNLKPFVQSAKKYLIGVPLLYWDDTVIFINTSRACMRFYGDGKVSLYTAHEKKDLIGIMEDGILPALSEGTTVMHDHNSINYHEGFVFRNIECIQHLERDLQKLADDSLHKWPLLLKDLITSTLHRRKQLIEQGIYSFTKEEVDEIFRMMKAILEDGHDEYIADPGHFYENDERALLNRLEQYADNYFEWIKDFDIPTTNNLSERSLRFSKTKSKISGQFESVEYASYFANIRTYLGTCLSNGINEFTALLRLTQGNPYTLTEILGGAI